MDGSVEFARLRQCALPWGHTDDTWRIRLNLCFLLPTRVHGQLTAESPYTLESAPLSQKLPIQWGIWMRSNTRFLGPPESSTQTASRPV